MAPRPHTALKKIEPMLADKVPAHASKLQLPFSLESPRTSRCCKQLTRRQFLRVAWINAHGSTPTPVCRAKLRPWSKQNSDQNSDHTRLCVYQGKEKVRPWSKSLGWENSAHGLNFGLPRGGGRSCLDAWREYLSVSQGVGVDPVLMLGGSTFWKLRGLPRSSPSDFPRTSLLKLIYFMYVRVLKRAVS